MAIEPNPGTPSSAYVAVQNDYAMIRAVLGGATRVRDVGIQYLAQYGAETKGEYDRRLASAPWRPEFVDALRNLASKPFSKEVSPLAESSETILRFCKDVDTLGNNLHVFARRAFYKGIAFGLHGILVDSSSKITSSSQSGVVTRADQTKAGARPYWCQVPAENIIALYTDVVNGRTIVEHVRIHEVITKRDGWGERQVDRVRVLEPGLWQVWEKNDKNEYVLISEGTLNLPEVPLALFYTGERDGDLVRPPLIDLADMQIELYRAMSRQDEILTFAGSPMLTANGMAPPKAGEFIEVGPKRILFAPPSGDGGGTPEWKFIQPDASNIEQVAKHVASIVDDMRRLGLQPLTPRTGTVTATGTSVEAAKAHSAVQSWANGMKDCLEQALKYTTQLFGEAETAEVFIHTDFGVDIDGGSDMAELLKARMAGELSQKTYWDEMLRRGKLGPQFEPDREELRLESEGMADLEDLRTEMVEPRKKFPADTGRALVANATQ